jgi:hypothetical protein
VASYRTWQEEVDRHVQEGESAIWIWAPIITTQCPEWRIDQLPVVSDDAVEGKVTYCLRISGGRGTRISISEPKPPRSIETSWT